MPHLIGFAVALLCISQTGVASGAADLLQQGEHELYAARYQTAAERYREVLKTDATGSGAYYGLVRALIADHRSREAYTAADEALRANPQTAATQTAAGLASFRRGDLAKAEEYLRAALKLDSGFAGALQGLASISSAVSRFKTSRDLLLAAYRRSPEDPDLIIAYANTLKGTEHVSTLQRALAILDPDTEQSRTLRAHCERSRDRAKKGPGGGQSLCRDEGQASGDHGRP
jgi:tetratricopeptide (TPR) repeat protein